MTKVKNDSQFNELFTTKPVSDILRNVQTFDPTTVPIAGDKKFGMDFAANYNRAKLEANFQAQQDDSANKNNDINGITTETVFEIPISAGETQESAMRRAYEKMADQAGLSTEPDGGNKKIFVESRLKLNTDANGKVAIEHIDKKPSTDYTSAEWAKIDKLNFRPNEQEITQLKELKSADNFNAGTKAADAIINALELGDRGIFDKLMSDKDASTELAKALNQVRENGGNYDYQQGLLNRLGADKVVKLEGMLSDNWHFNTVVKDALSTTGLENTGKQDKTANIRREIGEKSSLDELVRLTGDKTYPMDKNFLVGAGKNVTTKDVGWRNYSIVAPDGTAIYGSEIKPEAKQIFNAIAKSPEASTQLLQNTEFVKNSLLMKNAEVTRQGTSSLDLGSIIESGTSAEARAKNAQGVDKAILTIAETLNNPDSFRETSTLTAKTELIGMPKGAAVPEDVANALAKVVSENSVTFANAAQIGRNDIGRLDVKDVQSIFSTISQYESSKQKLNTALSVEVGKMLLDKTSFSNPKNVKSDEIGRLLDLYAEADRSASLKDASNADKKIELATKIFSDVAGLIPFAKLPTEQIAKVIASTTQNRIVDEVKAGGSGTFTDQAKGKILERDMELTTSVQLSSLKAYEQSAFETVNDANVNLEVKQTATEFIKNIRIYNDSLPANAKILDSNGRLKDTRTADIDSLRAMIRLSQGGIEDKTKPEAERASGKVGDIVRPTANAIEAKIKPE